MQLQHLTTPDLVPERAEILDLQLDTHDVAVRLPSDTRVVMHLDDDGTVRLRVFPAGADPYTLVASPTTPSLTLIDILEKL